MYYFVRVTAVRSVAPSGLTTFYNMLSGPGYYRSALRAYNKQLTLTQDSLQLSDSLNKLHALLLCRPLAQGGQDFAGFGGPVVEDRKAARFQAARDGDLLDQRADVRRVAPHAQTDARIAPRLARPLQLVCHQSLELAAMRRVVHGADEVEIAPVAPELPVLADPVAVDRPIAEDCRRYLNARP